MEEESRLDLLVVESIKFSKIAKDLLNTNDTTFKELFDKLYNMDKRNLALFIRKNINKITENQLKYADEYYKENGMTINWKIYKN